MPHYPDELWRAVADLSGLLLSEEDQETTLRRVSDLAVRSIDDCDAVGVTLFTGGKATTRAATGGLVYEIDHYQYDIGEGPRPSPPPTGRPEPCSRPRPPWPSPTPRPTRRA